MPSGYLVHLKRTQHLEIQTMYMALVLIGKSNIIQHPSITQEAFYQLDRLVHGTLMLVLKGYKLIAPKAQTMELAIHQTTMHSFTESTLCPTAVMLTKIN